MKYIVPDAYNWFAKLKLTQFIPWNFDREIDPNSPINDQFRTECEQDREVLTFGGRKDMDTFVGFEIKSGKVSENIIVFHPSFQRNVKGWNIIEAEYFDFFEFMIKRVLPDMKDWIPEDDVNEYIK